MFFEKRFLSTDNVPNMFRKKLWCISAKPNQTPCVKIQYEYNNENLHYLWPWPWPAGRKQKKLLCMCAKPVMRVWETYSDGITNHN